MASEKQATPHLFIDEVQGHQKRYSKLVQFTHSSTKAAGVMLLAAIVALVVANSAAYEPFIHFWHTEVGFIFGGTEQTMSLAHIINDVFMAIFFLLVGLEVKYEMTVGELTNIRAALLPIMGAVGGVAMPIVIYLLFNASNAEAVHGWGVPTATDIAFALGILALLGNRVPAGVRVFLSTLAVADDIIAILIIAIFYGQTPKVFWLMAAVIVMIVLIAMNRSHIYSLLPYILMGGVLWYCVFMSGIHSTIAGVLLAFAIPSGSRVNLRTFGLWSGKKLKEAHDTFQPETPVIAQGEYIETVTDLSRVARQVVPPATRLEHKLYPWVYFGILPVFALTNADVSFAGIDMGAMLTDPVLYGVFFGLLLGKPLGILAMSFICVKTKLGALPENVNWGHMVGAAILGGVGFTMAIFVANLAYTDEMHIATAKLGILAASLMAGIIGFVFLMLQAKRAQKQGVAFSESGDDFAEGEVEHAGGLNALRNPELQARIDAARARRNVFEIVVDLGPTGLLGGGSVRDVRDALKDEMVRVLQEEGRDDLIEKLQLQFQEDERVAPLAAIQDLVLQEHGEDALLRTEVMTSEDAVFTNLVKQSAEAADETEEQHVEGMAK